MVKHRNLIPHVLVALVLVPTIWSFNGDRKDYIVYMGKLSSGLSSVSDHHANIISEVVDERFASSALIRSYTRSFNGFVARLAETEAHKLAAFGGVVSVFPDTKLELHTTRSWNFLGLDATSPRRTTIESDTIIGVIDSGIWPESESFKDDGFGPPSKKWKGACKGGANFTCNNKLVGARFYSSMSSARDYIGHGTHTASIAAGNPVPNASFYGLARGVARGGVPSARIAAYKACSLNECSESDVLAAFDDAIADGVDIITVSLGPEAPLPFIKDVIAIGSFHAMEKGILTTQSAGNSGHEWKITISTAPWLFSIAASSIDRKFIDKIVLGTGITLVGTSVNSFEPADGFLPLVKAKDVGNASGAVAAQRQCYKNCLDPVNAAGKIVLCDYGYLTETERVHAAGAIFTSVDTDVAYEFPLPATVVNATVDRTLNHYIRHTKYPMARLLKSETDANPDAPLVASFSSTGPNKLVADVMKPDVTAPGIDILAAFSLDAPPSGLEDDPRRVAYNILSGTSMSCPHVAATAAYVKSFHPDWSLSAIKSAIMTTAQPIKQNGTDEFSYGSGHIDPTKALFPGLVYEIAEDDYVTVLCALGINVTLIARRNTTCHKGSPGLNPRDLNYPSVVTAVPSSFEAFTFKASRTVQNVGPPNTTYLAMMSVHPKLNITIVPQILSFESVYEEKSFVVFVSGPKLEPREVLSSSLVWSDGTREVRSPIVVYGS